MTQVHQVFGFHVDVTEMMNDDTLVLQEWFGLPVENTSMTTIVDSLNGTHVSHSSPTERSFVDGGQEDEVSKSCMMEVSVRLLKQI